MNTASSNISNIEPYVGFHTDKFPAIDWRHNADLTDPLNTFVHDAWWLGQQPTLIAKQIILPTSDHGIKKVRYQFTYRGQNYTSMDQEYWRTIGTAELESCTRGFLVRDIYLEGEPVRLIDVVPSMRPLWDVDPSMKPEWDKRDTETTWTRVHLSELFSLRMFHRAVQPLNVDLAGDWRVIYLQNGGSTIRYLQSEHIGPSHLRFNHRGDIMSAMMHEDSTNPMGRGRTLLVPPEYYTRTGRWRDETAEYLVREGITGDSPDFEVLK